MRVFFDVPFESRGIRRIAFQLAKYLPDSIEIATDPRSADISVIHVIGRRDHVLEQSKDYLNLGHKYAVIQYVLNSCRNPKPSDWAELWNNAKVVWSYYDLKKHIPNMYHAPLAADPLMFFPEQQEKKYLIGVNSNSVKSYDTECIGELRLATFRANKTMLYIGDPFGTDPNVEIKTNNSDNEMRLLYSQCHWFSALRRKDGFEMVAVEALLCGVRPIMFDTLNYRQWFDGLAEFISEDTPQNTARQLQQILSGNPKPVTNTEIEETKRRFNWQKIIEGFWKQCMS